MSGIDRQKVGQIAADKLNLASFEASKQPLQALKVHRLMQAVVDRLPVLKLEDRPFELLV